MAKIKKKKGEDNDSTVKSQEITAVDDHGNTIYKDGKPRKFTRRVCKTSDQEKWLGDEAIC